MVCVCGGGGGLGKYRRAPYLHRFVNQGLLNLQISLVEELLELLPVVELDWCGQAILEAIDLDISLPRRKTGKRKAREREESQHVESQDTKRERGSEPGGMEGEHLLGSTCCISPQPNIRS